MFQCMSGHHGSAMLTHEVSMLLSKQAKIQPCPEQERTILPVSCAISGLEQCGWAQGRSIF